MAKKISAKYWYTLKKFEQDYIHKRADIDGIYELKMKINDARKQQPGYNKIYGRGFIENNGKIFMWSGDTTRKYIELTGSSLIVHKK